MKTIVRTAASKRIWMCCSRSMFAVAQLRAYSELPLTTHPHRIAMEPSFLECPQACPWGCLLDHLEYRRGMANLLHSMPLTSPPSSKLASAVSPRDCRARAGRLRYRTATYDSPSLAGCTRRQWVGPAARTPQQRIQAARSNHPFRLGYRPAA